MELKSNLLIGNEKESLSFDSSIRGLYSTTQFVLRLNKDIRYVLKNEIELTPEKIQASSTYLHETIHWWQHIGSNLGFIFNLSYPAFAIESNFILKELIKKGIKYKPIINYERNHYEETGQTDIEELNRIVNTFYDLENAKNFLLDNQNIGKISEDKRFFISMGHCFMIMWSNSIEKLSDTLEDKFDLLPNTNNWVNNFIRLEKKQTEGFYIDSSYKISKIGIKAIFEGQAVFNQIIYLFNAFKQNNLVFQDFINKGILHGIYLKAFDYYLEIIKEERPIFIDVPLINLFLLVCDLSINPSNGFPCDIYNYEKFIEINDPGIRFLKMCEVIKENKSYYLKECKSIKKTTYVKLSWRLNKRIGSKCSYQSIRQIISWSENKSINELLKELHSHNFQEKNMPFRLLFSKYIDFNIDKYWQPEKICWIGHYLSSGIIEAKDLIDKHLALFLEGEDGEIKPKILKHIPKENVLKTFNLFYTHVIVYEIILKWISEKGKFKFDYKWLVNSRQEDIIGVVIRDFNSTFGVNIDDIETIE